MQLTTTRIRLEPFFRIQRIGCDIRVDSTGRGSDGAQHRLCITRDGSSVACEQVNRDSRFTNREMERRIRMSLVPYGTKVYSALERLADAAERLFRDGV